MSTRVFLVGLVAAAAAAAAPHHGKNKHPTLLEEVLHLEHDVDELVRDHHDLESPGAEECQDARFNAVGTENTLGIEAESKTKFRFAAATYDSSGVFMADHFSAYLPSTELSRIHYDGDDDGYKHTLWLMTTTKHNGYPEFSCYPDMPTESSTPEGAVRSVKAVFGYSPDNSLECLTAPMTMEPVAQDRVRGHFEDLAGVVKDLCAPGSHVKLADVVNEMNARYQVGFEVGVEPGETNQYIEIVKDDDDLRGKLDLVPDSTIHPVIQCPQDDRTPEEKAADEPSLQELKDEWPEMWSGAGIHANFGLKFEDLAIEEVRTDLFKHADSSIRAAWDVSKALQTLIPGCGNICQQVWFFTVWFAFVRAWNIDRGKAGATLGTRGAMRADEKQTYITMPKLSVDELIRAGTQAEREALLRWVTENDVLVNKEQFVECLVDALYNTDCDAFPGLQTEGLTSDINMNTRMKPTLHAQFRRALDAFKLDTARFCDGDSYGFGPMPKEVRRALPDLPDAGAVFDPAGVSYPLIQYTDPAVFIPGSDQVTTDQVTTHVGAVWEIRDGYHLRDFLEKPWNENFYVQKSLIGYLSGTKTLDELRELNAPRRTRPRGPNPFANPLGGGNPFAGGANPFAGRA